MTLSLVFAFFFSPLNACVHLLLTDTCPEEDKPEFTGVNNPFAAYNLSRLYQCAIKLPLTEPFAKLVDSTRQQLSKAASSPCK